MLKHAHFVHTNNIPDYVIPVYACIEKLSFDASDSHGFVNIHVLMIVGKPRSILFNVVVAYRILCKDIVHVNGNKHRLKNWALLYVGKP